MEEFRDIIGYEGKYQVSNLGRIKSLNYNRTGKEQILKLGKNKGGYLQIHFFKDGKLQNYSVHRLVASAFIPNPNNYKEVNHKDENKTNNCTENLEWISHIDNMNYGTRNERAGKAQKGKILSEETQRKISENHADFKGENHPMYGKRGSDSPNSRAVHCIELNKTWSCIKECAEELELYASSITAVCKNKRKTTGGYHFKYVEEENKNNVNNS